MQVACALLWFFLHGCAFAADGSFTPGYWDLQRHVAKPDFSALRVIRFLTEDDYPPFHFALPDGTLSGFDVEIARALCDELKLPCTIQPLRFDTLADALASGQGDALIAGLPMSAENRAKLDFTAPYHRSPARFAALRTKAPADAIPETLAGRSVGAVAGSAHAAFLQAFFAKTAVLPFETRDNLLSALKRGEIDLVFDDGVALSFWLNGADADECCAFVGGPYAESRYFGEGVAIAVRKDADTLRRTLDYALRRIAEKGVYTDLYLKYFPISFW